VADYYRNLGYKIIARNYIFPHGKQTGELDLVGLRNQELIFIEVKTRSSTTFGRPADSVNFEKQRKLVHTAKLYLQQHPQYAGKTIRIDVATVDIDNKANPVIIIPNAIEDLD